MKLISFPQTLSSTIPLFLLPTSLLPHLTSYLLTRYLAPTPQQSQLIQSFSLLLLGMFVSALATLNFSLSFLIGLLSSPLSFIRPTADTTTTTTKALLKILLLHLLSPSTVLYAFGLSVKHVLLRASFAWNVHAVWTPVVVWCVWWPAWFVGVMLLGLGSGQK